MGEINDDDDSEQSCTVLKKDDRSDIVENK